MTETGIVEFLKNQVQPLPDNIYGPRYRAAAYLTDDTYLPCVVFQSKKKQTELALRRLQELKSEKDQYEMIIEHFATGGTQIAPYNIKKVEASPYALPKEFLDKVHGETAMGWTCFVVEMNDGERFNFGSSFHFEYFDLPTGYSFNDIKAISSGMVYFDTRGVVSYNDRGDGDVKYFREKPFFTCYSDLLDVKEQRKGFFKKFLK